MFEKILLNIFEWALATNGWHQDGISGTFDISKIEQSEESKDKYRD
jgi:hypothetical protein